MKAHQAALAAFLVLSLGAAKAQAAPSGIYSFGTLFEGEGTGASGYTCQVSTDDNNGTITAAFNAPGGATILNGLVIDYDMEPSSSNGYTSSYAGYFGIASLTPGGNTITFDQTVAEVIMPSRVRFKRYYATTDGAGNITLTFIVTVGDCEAPFKAFFHATTNKPAAP